MKLVIYESSSFGGCYQYALHLYRAYREIPVFQEVVLILPENADFLADEPESVFKILKNDRRGGKLRFLLRQFQNPLKLFYYLGKQERSFVLLNDFEQITAPFWSPLYRLFLKKHSFAVFLHDPDRDNYPPSRFVSSFCMKSMLKACKLALFHAPLPAKSYYRSRKHLTYLPVFHGPYNLPIPDKGFMEELQKKTAGYRRILSIPGNIREEKNYDLVIEALAAYPESVLIVSGNAANSTVDTGKYLLMAEKLGVRQRVIWIERFLSDSELAAVILISDLVLLYYSSSFNSQSGILHQVASLRKQVLVSELNNSLTHTVKRFQLGIVCKADDRNALITALSYNQLNIHTNWDDYIRETNWSEQVNTVVSYLRTEKLIN